MPEHCNFHINRREKAYILHTSSLLKKQPVMLLEK